VYAVQRGDHIYVARGLGPVRYTHHGIAISPYQAIHFDAGPARATVRYVWLTDFARGRDVKVRVHRDAKFAPDEVVQRAQSQLGKADVQLLGRNGEHFAAWCVTDQSEGDEVELRWSMVAAAVCVSAAVAIAPIGAPAVAEAIVVAGVAGAAAWNLSAERTKFGD
jgi:hypothetical protein